MDYLHVTAVGLDQTDFSVYFTQLLGNLKKSHKINAKQVFPTYFLTFQSLQYFMKKYLPLKIVSD